MSGGRTAAGSVAVMTHREHSHSPLGSMESPAGSSESFGDTEAHVSVSLFGGNTYNSSVQRTLVNTHVQYSTVHTVQYIHTIFI